MKGLKKTFWVIGALVAILVGLGISYNALEININNSPFLDGKKTFLTGEEYTWFWPVVLVHSIPSCLVLFIGLIQLMRKSKSGAIHKKLGRAYAALIVFVSAPSGLVLGYFAYGGASAQISFYLLSSLWAVFTFKAWQLAIKGSFELHRQYMWRSFALSLSAISLRLYSYFFVIFFQYQGIDAYVWLTWLSWVPNLLMIELYIRFYRKHSRGSHILNTIAQ